MMRPLLIAAAATLMAQGPASAQTAAMRRAREVVAIINTASPRLLKAYVDSAFGGPMRDTPPDAYVNTFLGLRERSGGLAWVVVQEDSAYRAVVRLTRQLTGEEPLPQTIYRVKTIAGQPSVAFVKLNVRF